MSIQATEAAAAAASRARAAWREHVGNCSQCSRARHRRAADRDKWRCLSGAGMRRTLLDAELVLERAREADRKPLPGQAELPLDLPGQASLFGDTP